MFRKAAPLLTGAFLKEMWLVASTDMVSGRLDAYRAGWRVLIKTPQPCLDPSLVHQIIPNEIWLFVSTFA